MGKRATNQAAPKATTKKAKVESKVDPAFQTVSDAIMEAEQLPDRVRAMLVEMLPFSLKFASDERHELQSMAVDMVDQTLNAKKSALDSTAVGEAEALATLKASETQLGTTVQDSEAALAAQKEVVQAKKTALAEAEAAENASATSLTDKCAERKAAQEQLAAMKVEKDAIESAFAEHFKPMEEGEGKGHLKKLEPFLKKIEIESTLLTALPSSCAKAKDKRGTFDHLVLQELDKAFAAKIAGLGAAIVADGPASEQRDAGVQAAERDHEAKKAVLTQAQAELEAAEKEASDREAAHNNAKQAVEDFHPKVAEVTGRLSEATTALADFEAGPFANFLVFQSRVAALPAAEEPAAEEPAAEAEAATEAAAPAAEAAAEAASA